MTQAETRENKAAAGAEAAQAAQSGQKEPVTVITAETAGFCFGVDRAVNMVYEQLASGRKPLYTYGPIIHNETVVGELEAAGVRILDGPEALEHAEPGTVVIRSHGTTRAEQERMEELGFTVADATCPFVKRIHRLAEEAQEQGRQVIIIGDPSHPEVRGICGWCRSEPLVIAEEEEILRDNGKNRYFAVSQTTFNLKKFEKIVAKLKKSGYDISVVNTICNATQRRQSEAEAIASQVDAMIVIGGSQSSNTRKLCDICRANCAKTYYIQSANDLSNLGFIPVRSVGITAGASTPKKIIEEVQSYVRNKL